VAGSVFGVDELFLAVDFEDALFEAVFDLAGEEALLFLVVLDWVPVAMGVSVGIERAGVRLNPSRAAQVPASVALIFQARTAR
jgi:hypothetical protein